MKNDTFIFHSPFKMLNYAKYSAKCVNDKLMIIHMIRITGNANGTNDAGAAQPDRETAACGVLVRVELAVREGLTCVLQLCEKPQRGRFHQVNRVALAREPQFAVRLCALTEAAEHDQTVHRNLNRNRLLLCVFMQLEADFQRILARKMLKLKLLLLLLHTWRSSFCNPAYCPRLSRFCRLCGCYL